MRVIHFLRRAGTPFDYLVAMASPTRRQDSTNKIFGVPLRRPPAVVTEAFVLEALGTQAWSDQERAYIREHRRRFAFLLNLVAREFDRLGAHPATPATFMDVGPHMITGLVDRLFGDRVRIDTMGWENPRVYDPARIRRHFQFDLNDAYDPACWPQAMEHDIVLIAEVIEHLYTAPEQVLACLRTFVRPGGVLIVGTPNAAALQHRVRLVAGRNPYERIRLDRTNPGHFREYTAAELVEIARAAGFGVTRVSHHDFNPSDSWLVRSVMGAWPPSLRRMMTVVMQRV